MILNTSVLDFEKEIVLKIPKPFPYDDPFAKYFSSMLSCVYILISKVLFKSGCLAFCSLFRFPS